MNYWLAHSEGGKVEGPFAVGQLQAMFASGQVTAKALACPEGGQEWLLLSDLLTPAPVSGRAEPSFAEQMVQRDEESVRNMERAGGVLIFLTVLGSFAPLVGLLMWGVYSVVAVICSILAIVMMTKGAVDKGIWCLVVTWIVTPIAMIIAQMVGIAAAGALAG